MKTNMTGIILAGGKNSRMGVNKAFLEINGIRLIDKVLSVFKELFSETVTHEIFHAIEELFDKSFNHKRINKALSQIIKDK